MIERADDLLTAGIWETKRMTNVTAIITSIKKDGKRGKLIELTRGTDESVDRLLDGHEGGFCGGNDRRAEGGFGGRRKVDRID
jgi:hypothetical protein